MSGIGFTVEAIQDTPEARAKGEQAEKALYQVYEANNLEQLDLETETDCAILGDGCYKVTWEVGEGELLAESLKLGEKGRVRITAPDVQGIYAWWRGDDISRVWRVASTYQMSGEEVERLYGKKENPSVSPFGKGRTVVEVWTDDEFELYLDSQLIEKKPNTYGFIPFIIFPKTPDT